MTSFYLGIDLHLKRSYITLMDQTGNILKEKRINNKKIEEYLGSQIPKDTCAVMEATRNWAFLYDFLVEKVCRVELAHPKRLKAIASATVKTDRIDAKTLAHLARLNYLPTAYAAPKEIRDLRLYVRHRNSLVEQRTQAKNRIKAVLARYNTVAPMSNLYGVKGREFLRETLEKIRPMARRVIEDLLFLIDVLNQRIQALEEDLELDRNQRKIVALLKTMPGIGDINAITLLAEIGDISRFSSSKALCHWAGLTPRVRKSDQVVHHGRITKEGSPFVRAAMTSAAQIATKISPKWNSVYENLKPRCGNIGAKVAVARRLLGVIYYMWKRQQPYQENYRSQVNEPATKQGA